MAPRAIMRRTQIAITPEREPYEIKRNEQEEHAELGGFAHGRFSLRRHEDETGERAGHNQR